MGEKKKINNPSDNIKARVDGFSIGSIGHFQLFLRAKRFPIPIIGIINTAQEYNQST